MMVSVHAEQPAGPLGMLPLRSILGPNFAGVALIELTSKSPPRCPTAQQIANNRSASTLRPPEKR